MIDYIGTVVVGLASLYITIFLFLKGLRKINYPKKVLLIIFTFLDMSCVLRIIYLITSMGLFDYWWHLVPIVSNIGLFFIGLMILFGNKQKTLMKIFIPIFLIIIFFLPFIQMDINMRLFIILIFAIIPILIFLYIFIKFTSESSLVYLTSLILFTLAGTLSRYYYPFLYILTSLAIVVLSFSFKKLKFKRNKKKSKKLKK